MEAPSDLLQPCFSHTLDSRAGSSPCAMGRVLLARKSPAQSQRGRAWRVRALPARRSKHKYSIQRNQYWKRFARRNRTTLDVNNTAGIPADYTAGIPTELRVKLQFGQLWHSWHSNWIHSWYSDWIVSENVRQRTMRNARMKWKSHEVESESTNNTGFRFRTKRSCRDLKTDSTARSSEIRNHLLNATFEALRLTTPSSPSARQ